MEWNLFERGYDAALLDAHRYFDARADTNGNYIYSICVTIICLIKFVRISAF